MKVIAGSCIKSWGVLAMEVPDTAEGQSAEGPKRWTIFKRNISTPRCCPSRYISLRQHGGGASLRSLNGWDWS